MGDADRRVKKVSKGKIVVQCDLPIEEAAQALMDRLLTHDEFGKARGDFWTGKTGKADSYLEGEEAWKEYDKYLAGIRDSQRDILAETVGPGLDLLPLPGADLAFAMDDLVSGNLASAGTRLLPDLVGRLARKGLLKSAQKVSVHAPGAGTVEFDVSAMSRVGRAAAKSAKHHNIPMFAGGEKVQRLLPLRTDLHKEWHGGYLTKLKERGLDPYVKDPRTPTGVRLKSTAEWAKEFDDHPERFDEAMNALLEFNQEFDAHHGTDTFLRALEEMIDMRYRPPGGCK